MNRSRWAAIGAAVAVSLGAGGFGLASATVSDGEMPVYIAIDPCRLTDSRPAAANGTTPPVQIGSRVTPYTAGETVVLVGTGVQGNCNVPAGVSALQLNVTALNASQATFLQFAPGTTLVPDASSSLNPTPGEPPTPNAVTIAIDDSGQFSLFNKFGSVDVVIDIVGYYDDHVHTGADIVDESLTGADVQNNTLSDAETSNEAGIAYNSRSTSLTLAAADDYVVRTRINVPSDGYVVAIAELQWENGTAGLDRARCQLTKGNDETIDGTQPYLRMTDGGDTGTGLFYSDSHQFVFEVDAADDTFDVFAGTGQYINLVCDLSNGAVSVEYATVTLQFFPTDYTSGGLILFPFLAEIDDGGSDV